MSADDDVSKRSYDVGFGKPPKASQFKPGNKAAQKRSAPKKQTLDQVFEDVLSRRVELRQDGKKIKVSMREAIALRVSSDAVAGKTAAINILLGLMARSDTIGENLQPPILLEEDDALLADFLRQNASDHNDR